MEALSVRAVVESRCPGAFAPAKRPEARTLRTGIAALDARLGGVPLGALTELCGGPGISSGVGTVLHALLAESTQAGVSCALIDAADTFDPVSAESAGVRLPHLLWVRCAGQSPAGLPPLEQAFRCADLLLQCGGFGLMVLDLAGVEARRARRVPLTTWFRLTRVVERMGSALVVATPHPLTGSYAGLALQCRMDAADWLSTERGRPLPHTTLLGGCAIECEVMRVRPEDRKRPSRTEQSRFPAECRWA